LLIPKTVDAAADAVAIYGLASRLMFERALTETCNIGIFLVFDNPAVQNPAKVVEKLRVKPDIMELHRAIDTDDASHAWGDIPAIRKAAGGKLLVATAGGIRVNVVKDALKAGADLLVVGRAITASKDIGHAADECLEQLNSQEIDQFRVMTDF
jgi:bifunctional enzyme Fae/Hps